MHDLAGLPEGWDCKPLAALVKSERGISYGVVQPGRDVVDGVPIVRVNNIKDGRIKTDDVLTVAKELEAKYSRTRLVGGEVLLTLVGTLGECAVVPSDLNGWNVARAVGVIPVEPPIDPRWIAICLRSAPLQHLIRTWATTTVQATFNLRDVARLPIPLPPQPIRESITEILSTLDDKIDLNRRMNATLEAMARALFQTWFVDFEPARAKAAGQPVLALKAELAGLFPPSVQESQVGQIPLGWSVEPFDVVADFLNGLALQKYPARDGEPYLPVIKIAQLRTGSVENADRANLDVPDPYVVQDGDLLFSWSGSLEVVLWCGGRGALNQHLFKVTSERFPKWFVYLWLLEHLSEFRAIAAAKATTMGHIQRRHLTAAQVVLPTEELIKLGADIIAPLLDKVIANNLESRSLATARDLLLPKLLTGEVRVRP